MKFIKKQAFWTGLSLLALLLIHDNIANAYQLVNRPDTPANHFGHSQSRIIQLHSIEESHESRSGGSALSILDRSGEDPASFWEAVITGKITLNNRFRLESVRMEGVNNSLAVTNRLQLGYGTRPYRGFSGFIDFVHVHPFDYGRYNAAGLNDRPDRAVVADPRLTVLNQLYGQYEAGRIDGLLRIGRQRIIHQDARFVGNVGWRQNEQTYDALLATTSFGIEGLTMEYNYIWQVNRIFGPDHPMGAFDSDSHMGVISYENFPLIGTLTGFLYLLDFDNAPSLSANTIGLRFKDKLDLERNLSINYLGSYARQTDAGSNPQPFEAGYYHLDINLERQNSGHIGASYEVLGSDGGEAAFRFPLATLHAYQGWADVFLSTPDQGIDDISLYIGIELPRDISSTIRYHRFYKNEGSGLHGEELNISLQKQFSEFWSVLIKFADFQGSGSLADRQKLWFQTEIRF